VERLSGKSFGFIGGGKMAEAILKGILSSPAIDAGKIAVTDVSEARLDYIHKTYGVKTELNDAATNAAAARLAGICDIVILAVKPQYARPVVRAVGQVIGQDRLVLSIIGGATLETLEQQIPVPVVRIMPNTPMMVGSGVAGMAPGSRCTDDHTEIAKAIFELVGKVYILPEQHIDALTGISGCGPAYAYIFIEALADAGVAAGLSREMAEQLAAQTLVGAGQMVVAGGMPAQLKNDVCSPGGSTIAGVAALEKGGFRGVVLDAVAAAGRRMAEIAQKL
jgi:pyrroline-5-carboxylate reductase